MHTLHLHCMSLGLSSKALTFHSSFWCWAVELQTLSILGWWTPASLKSDFFSNTMLWNLLFRGHFCLEKPFLRSFMDLRTIYWVSIALSLELSVRTRDALSILLYIRGTQKPAETDANLPSLPHHLMKGWTSICPSVSDFFSLIYTENRVLHERHFTELEKF